MLGKLNERQIDQLLTDQVTGRIACYANESLYIVPVNYAYYGTFVYGHSRMGKKIEMMRQNPNVCFEIDDITNIFLWKSVIAWGVFEEITDEAAQQQVMQKLIHRIMPFSGKPSDQPSHGI